MKRTAASAALLLALSVNSSVRAADVAVRVNRPQPVGEEVAFTANGVGTGALTYAWDFGDGIRSEPSRENSATHTYNKPGHYPVIVVVKDESRARSDSFLQTVYRPITDGAPTASSTIVHHVSAASVCNVNADNDTISCTSTDDLKVLFEVAVGDHPRSLAVAPDGTIWVVNQDDATVTVLDAAGGQLAVLSLPRASKPFGIALNVARGVAYVTLQALGQLIELDLRNGRILRTVDVGPWATGVAVDGSGKRVFVTRFISSDESGEVTELDAAELSIKRVFELAHDPGPDTEASSRGVPNYLRSVVISPDGSEAWVPSKKDNIQRGLARDGERPTFETSVRTIVSFLDLKENEEQLDARVDLNNRSLGLSVTFSPLGDYGFVGLMGNNGVEVFDAYNRRIVAGEFELGQAPDGLVLDSNGKLYVHSFLSRSLTVLDASRILDSTGFAFERIDEVVVSEKEKLDEQVLWGKQIFYDAADPRMGQDGYISCATCHIDGLEDGRVWDFSDRGEGLRNTTSLLGKRGMGQGRLHWSANFDEVQDFEHDIRGPFAGLGFLDDAVWEEGTHSQTLGDPKTGKSEELDALSAYVTSLDRFDPSPYRAGDGRLTEAGWKGMRIFIEAGCPNCHGGDDFTDSAKGVLHDVGTLRQTSGKRLGEPLEGLDTPTLRGIWQTAPYLHDGSAKTLDEVVGKLNSDDRHGSTQKLSDDERADLVSYLMQIDNTPIEKEVAPHELSVEEDSGAFSNNSKCSLALAPGAPAPQQEGREYLRWTLLGCLALLVGGRQRRLALPSRSNR